MKLNNLDEIELNRLPYRQLKYLSHSINWLIVFPIFFGFFLNQFGYNLAVEVWCWPNVLQVFFGLAFLGALIVWLLVNTEVNVVKQRWLLWSELAAKMLILTGIFICAYFTKRVIELDSKDVGFRYYPNLWYFRIKLPLEILNDLFWHYLWEKPVHKLFGQRRKELRK